MATKPLYDFTSAPASVMREEPPAWLAGSSHWPAVLRRLGVDHQGGPGFLLVRAATGKGLERAAFEAVKDSYGVTAEVLARVTHIPLRTLSRRERFKPEESERILRVASVFQIAEDVLESPAAAQRWLTSPKRALAGLTPLDCCDTEVGAREVEQLLERLAEGVFS